MLSVTIKCPYENLRIKILLQDQTLFMSCFTQLMVLVLGKHKFVSEFFCYVNLYTFPHLK